LESKDINFQREMRPFLVGGSNSLILLYQAFTNGVLLDHFDRYQNVFSCKFMSETEKSPVLLGQEKTGPNLICKTFRRLFRHLAQSN